MSSFSPWGGLGEPGEACVKCGGNPTTLGAHAPTRGALPKTKGFFVIYELFCHRSGNLPLQRSACFVLYWGLWSS